MPIYFYESNHSLPIEIESIGNQWDQEEVDRPLGYPFYHWLQTTQGEGIITINDTTILLEKGQGIFIAPFTPHHYTPKRDWQTNFLTLRGAVIQDIRPTTDTFHYVLATESTDFSFNHWIEQEILQQDGFDPFAMSGACYRFILELFRHQTTNDAENRAYQNYVVPVLTLIETNYHEIISVESLAESCKITPQYLTRVFKQFLGQSTSQYLIQYRLNRAKELLINHPDLPVQEIAFRTGFQDASYFAAQFKKRVGFTPVKFRQLYR